MCQAEWRVHLTVSGASVPKRGAIISLSPIKVCITATAKLTTAAVIRTVFIILILFNLKICYKIKTRFLIILNDFKELLNDIKKVVFYKKFYVLRMDSGGFGVLSIPVRHTLLRAEILRKAIPALCFIPIIGGSINFPNSMFSVATICHLFCLYL